MITRRQFLYGSAASIGLSSVSPFAWSYEPPVLNKGKHPNVLCIMVDDLRCELGCYGQQHIHSPSIDKLAAGGTCFQNAHVQMAVCAASRASFLTGCRPDTTGVDYPYTPYFSKQFLPKHATFPHHFAQQGYYTECMGKWHHGPRYELQRYYQLSDQEASGSTYCLPDNKNLKGKQRPPTEIADVPDEAYGDGALTLKAINAMRRSAKQAKPFFLGVGYVKPHLPFNAPKKYWDLYDPNKIELSPSADIPKGAPFYAPASYELPSYNCHERINSKGIAITDEKLARHLRHGYFACVSFIDAQIGKLVEELEKLGLKDDTIIMLASDHGWHLGDQGCWGKHTNYEAATRSPLIVAGPGVNHHGNCNALVEYVDMYPSLCDLAGITAPTWLEGTSFKPLCSEPGQAWKSAAFSQYSRWGKSPTLEGYAIRDKRYRYVEWRQVKNIKDGFFKGNIGHINHVELYDHQQDPHESTNIAKAKPEICQQLSQALKDGWRKALPPGITNTSNNQTAPNVVNAWP